MTAADMATRAELLEASDAQIDAAIGHADPLVLRGLLHQLTGDPDLARMRVGVVVRGRARLTELLDAADVEIVREKAAAFLRAHRDAGAPAIGFGPTDRLPRSLSYAAGADIPDHDVEMWTEELALDPWARGLEWKEPPAPEALEGFHVLVIGAGMGGLNAAVLLKRAGISFTVIEKNPDVGGTWFENRYPGARVDTLSRTYTHLFGAGYVYPNDYCGWEDNRRYLEWVADTFGIRDDIVFETEVSACRWDEETATWSLETSGPDGERTYTANAVFSAVGFLSRPVIPEIEGAASFAGRAFHSARWPADLDVAGKRIGVIGSGCTGYQTVPELALAAGHVHVFQRTPQWIFPVAGYRTPLPPEIPWLDRNLPFHINFNRFRAQYLTGPEMGRIIYNVEPGFEDEHARSELNKQIRDACIDFVREKLGEKRPELVERMIPPHPPLSARPVIVDEEYSILDALCRDDVTLETEGIRRITPTGIELLDGREIELDVIVYATGFNANAFLFPMEIRGRDGREIQELWEEDGPRAYLGAMMPGFPNLFVIYGPNTNPFGGGLGLVSHEEMTTRFGLRCLEHLIATGQRSVDVTEAAYRRYNAELDEAEQLRLYADPRANTYYRHTTGRSAANCPFGGDEMWRWLKEPDLGEVVLA